MARGRRTRSSSAKVSADDDTTVVKEDIGQPDTKSKQKSKSDRDREKESAAETEPAKKKRRQGKDKETEPQSSKKGKTAGKSKSNPEGKKEAKEVNSPKTMPWPPTTDVNPAADDSIAKIVSWNVAGLRSCVKKGFEDYVTKEKPDILCLNELKCAKEDVDQVECLSKEVFPYQYWAVSTVKKGYAGIAVLSKFEPLNVATHFGDGHKEVSEGEGRYLCIEYQGFYLVAAYIPNAGRGLTRLDYRLIWDKAFCEHLSSLQQQKPVLVAGDLNVAHTPRDLANPSGNKRSAGFTWEERRNFDHILGVETVGENGEELVDWKDKQRSSPKSFRESYSDGPRLADVYRHFYPEREGAFTYWTYMAGARGRNIGWRLDYFLASRVLLPKIADIEHRHKVLGSDHCPILLQLKKGSLF